MGAEQVDKIISTFYNKSLFKMEAVQNIGKLFTSDDKVTVLVGIELEDEEKIPYFISFYKRTNENQNTREGFLNFGCNDFIKKK